jgi:glycosyltransferase involved in cell wall biosynthesis
VRITVVVPAFNAARFVGEAIEAALSQTLPPERVIVVDDGSTDGTAEIAGRFGSNVACVRQPNRGVAAARNRGASMAETEWLAFLDADDVWLPTKLDRQREALVATGASAGLTALRLFYDDDTPSRDVGMSDVRTDLSALLMHQVNVPQGTSSTLLVRAPVFRAVGGYDEALSTVADWDLLVRLRLVAEFAYVPEPLVLYRRYGGTMSRNAEVLERESVQVLTKAFASKDLPRDVRCLRNRCFAWNDVILSGSYFWTRRWSRAVRLGLRGVWRDPRLINRLLGFPGRHAVRLWTGQPRPGTL